MAMIRLEPLSSDPDFVRAFARVVAEAQGYVCRVCGLERLGHVPDYRRAGWPEHDWQPIKAEQR